MFDLQRVDIMPAARFPAQIVEFFALAVGNGQIGRRGIEARNGNGNTPAVVLLLCHDLFVVLIDGLLDRLPQSIEEILFGAVRFVGIITRCRDCGDKPEQGGEILAGDLLKRYARTTPDQLFAQQFAGLYDVRCEFIAGGSFGCYDPAVQVLVNLFPDGEQCFPFVGGEAFPGAGDVHPADSVLLCNAGSIAQLRISVADQFVAFLFFEARFLLLPGCCLTTGSGFFHRSGHKVFAFFCATFL